MLLIHFDGLAMIFDPFAPKTTSDLIRNSFARLFRLPSFSLTNRGQGTQLAKQCSPTCSRCQMGYLLPSSVFLVHPAVSSLVGRPWGSFLGTSTSAGPLIVSEQQPSLLYHFVAAWEVKTSRAATLALGCVGRVQNKGNSVPCGIHLGE